MRAVRCWCEELLVAEDDAQLLDALRTHVEERHPDEPRGEDELEARVAEATEPPDRPPWVY